MGAKHIFITGGVVSGLGKGITAASLGRLLKERGYKVTIQKFDPYLNVNPGNMSPYQHGEVFVTDDGAECDLDVGHYERFVDENMSVNSNVSSGKIYWSVLNKERSGEYNGKTVQVIPHITNEIKDRLTRAERTEPVDIVITEIGGTVGDIESLPLLEAIRQVHLGSEKNNTVFVHVTLVPYIAGSNELKSKPTQHSVKELLSLGISPDVLVCRSESPLPDELKEKIALFCNVRPQDVIDNLTAETLYEIPLMLEAEGFANIVCEHLQIENRKADFTDWRELVDRIKNPDHSVKIGVVGKYTELPDAYLSLSEALRHAGFENNTAVEIELIRSELLEDTKQCPDPAALLSEFDGIVIPGGFGPRGVEGKICALQYARENGIPTLGISLGMQLMAIEYARNVMGMKDANSTEFAPDCDAPVVFDFPRPEDEPLIMRLGLHPCKLTEQSKASSIYDTALIYERHRHKYEINTKYRSQFDGAGFLCSGLSPDEKFIEIMELEAHPWYIGVEFHAEFKSRPNHAHPLFKSFVASALSNSL